jgi:hypothetical protein
MNTLVMGVFGLSVEPEASATTLSPVGVSVNEASGAPAGVGAGDAGGAELAATGVGVAGDFRVSDDRGVRLRAVALAAVCGNVIGATDEPGVGEGSTLGAVLGSINACTVACTVGLTLARCMCSARVNTKTGSAMAIIKTVAPME